MDISSWLTILNVLIAFLGVFIVGFAVFEWHQLRTLRASMESLEERTSQRIYASLKAAHRVLASYSVTDPRQRITLLEAALEADPDAYNAWNTLGYAFLEIEEVHKAVDAFSQAVFRHPDDKAGYCDLAYAHRKTGNDALAVKYLRKALRKDASVLEDIRRDERLAALVDKL